MRKLYIYMRSVILAVILKVIYYHKIKLSFFNSFRGKISIHLEKNSNLFIGRFLMTQGPLYIKALSDSKIKIGHNVFFNHNCSITCLDEVLIGNRCNIANNVIIVDHDHKYDKNGVITGYNCNRVKIGNNVWIGANSVILKGVEIGDGAIVAAGAVVNSNIPPHELWGGVPAVKIKRLEEAYDS